MAVPDEMLRRRAELREASRRHMEPPVLSRRSLPENLCNSKVKALSESNN
jgi:hypothetical protein